LYSRIYPENAKHSKDLNFDNSASEFSDAEQKMMS
jgi:hypothetical protein